jgi:dihydropyrimidinase
LRPGADADVVVWDPKRVQSLDADRLHMATDHSPYAGIEVSGWPEVVIARGDVVARDGRYVGEPARGRFVKRAPR